VLPGWGADDHPWSGRGAARLLKPTTGGNPGRSCLCQQRDVVDIGQGPLWGWRLRPKWIIVRRASAAARAPKMPSCAERGIDNWWGMCPSPYV
jgi:hypothetical protein